MLVCTTPDLCLNEAQLWGQAFLEAVAVALQRVGTYVRSGRDAVLEIVKGSQQLVSVASQLAQALPEHRCRGADAGRGFLLLERDVRAGPGIGVKSGELWEGGGRSKAEHVGRVRAGDPHV